jgi:hypothetical protein
VIARSLIALTCLALLSALGPTRAQKAADDALQTDAGLEATAEAIRNGICTGDYEAVWKALGPEQQAAVTRQRENMVKHFGLAQVNNPELIAAYRDGFGQLDPAGTLGLNEPADLHKLNDAQFFALACGLIAISHEMAKAANDEWFMTERATGVRTDGSRKRLELRPAGAVIFESVAGWCIEINFEPVASAWKPTDFVVQYDSFEVTFSEFLQRGAQYDVPLEQLLPPLHAFMLRVRLAVRDQTIDEDGERPLTLRQLGADEDDRRIHDYVLRDKIYASETHAGIAADPDGEGPWVLFTFPWAGGKGEYLEFATEAALDAEIAKRFPE